MSALSSGLDTVMVSCTPNWLVSSVLSLAELDIAQSDRGARVVRNSLNHRRRGVAFDFRRVRTAAGGVEVEHCFPIYLQRLQLVLRNRVNRARRDLRHGIVRDQDYELAARGLFPDIVRGPVFHVELGLVALVLAQRGRTGDMAGFLVQFEPQFA